MDYWERRWRSIIRYSKIRHVSIIIYIKYFRVLNLDTVLRYVNLCHNFSSIPLFFNDSFAKLYIILTEWITNLFAVERWSFQHGINTLVYFDLCTTNGINCRLSLAEIMKKFVWTYSVSSTLNTNTYFITFHRFTVKFQVSKDISFLKETS